MTRTKRAYNLRPLGGGYSGQTMSDICTPRDGRCPHRPGLICSLPHHMRSNCTELEAHRRNERNRLQIRVKISSPRGGETIQKGGVKDTPLQPKNDDCFACYPQPGKKCSTCSKMVDCQVQTYISGLRDLVIAADVRAVQARLF